MDKLICLAAAWISTNKGKTVVKQIRPRTGVWRKRIYLVCVWYLYHFICRKTHHSASSASSTISPSSISGFMLPPSPVAVLIVSSLSFSFNTDIVSEYPPGAFILSLGLRLDTSISLPLTTVPSLLCTLMSRPSLIRVAISVSAMAVHAYGKRKTSSKPCSMFIFLDLNDALSFSLTCRSNLGSDTILSIPPHSLIKSSR